MAIMGKLNSYFWAFLQLYVGMSQERRLLKFMKFYSNLSWVLITLKKNYNLFVELASKPHCKSFTWSGFLWMCEFVKLYCDRQHSVEFFVLNLHLISFIKEWSRKVTLPGERGDSAFPRQTVIVVWGDYARQKRETGS